MKRTPEKDRREVRKRFDPKVREWQDHLKAAQKKRIRAIAGYLRASYEEHCGGPYVHKAEKIAVIVDQIWRVHDEGRGGFINGSEFPAIFGPLDKSPWSFFEGLHDAARWGIVGIRAVVDGVPEGVGYELENNPELAYWLELDAQPHHYENEDGTTGEEPEATWEEWKTPPLSAKLAAVGICFHEDFPKPMELRKLLLPFVEPGEAESAAGKDAPRASGPAMQPLPALLRGSADICEAVGVKNYRYLKALSAKTRGPIICGPGQPPQAERDRLVSWFEEQKARMEREHAEREQRAEPTAAPYKSGQVAYTGEHRAGASMSVKGTPTRAKKTKR